MNPDFLAKVARHAFSIKIHPRADTVNIQFTTPGTLYTYAEVTGPINDIDELLNTGLILAIQNSKFYTAD